MPWNAKGSQSLCTQNSHNTTAKRGHSGLVHLSIIHETEGHRSNSIQTDINDRNIPVLFIWRRQGWPITAPSWALLSLLKCIKRYSWQISKANISTRPCGTRARMSQEASVLKWCLIWMTASLPRSQAEYADNRRRVLSGFGEEPRVFGLPEAPALFCVAWVCSTEEWKQLWPPMWAWNDRWHRLTVYNTVRQANPKKARAGMACRACTSPSQTKRTRLQHTRSQQKGSAPLGVIPSPEKSSRPSHQLPPRLGACSYSELTLQNSAPLSALLKAL